MNTLILQSACLAFVNCWGIKQSYLKLCNSKQRWYRIRSSRVLLGIEVFSPIMLVVLKNKVGYYTPHDKDMLNALVSSAQLSILRVAFDWTYSHSAASHSWVATSLHNIERHNVYSRPFLNTHLWSHRFSVHLHGKGVGGKIPSFSSGFTMLLCYPERLKFLLRICNIVVSL